MLLNKEDFYEVFPVSPDEKFAVAFSGGGDSTALLYCFSEMFGSENIVAIHFNHGLRIEADTEQNNLEIICNKLNIKFIAGKWQEKPQGNVQQSARNARYKFLQKICKENGLKRIYTGHNQDDIAETMLMRMARGSGLKGLASMSHNTTIHGINVCRPLLGINRDNIRNYLLKNKVEWLDDPSNNDEKYFRVRIRKAKNKLEEIGISFESIVASASSLQRAERFIENSVSEYYKKNISIKSSIISCTEKLLHEDEELIIRVIDKIITSLTHVSMSPRTTKKQRLIKHLKTSDKRYELGGVSFYKNQYKIHAKKV